MRIGEATNVKDLVAACEEARLRRLRLRIGFETIWWNNLALLAGDHYAEWSPVQGQLISADVENDRVRLALNHALTVGRTELAKLTKSRPIMDVVAKSGENEDISAAKVSKNVLEDMEWRFKLRKTRKQAGWWMIGCGLGAVYVGWDYADKKAGELVYYIDPNTNSPTFNPVRIDELRELEQAGEVGPIKEERMALGDVEYKIFSPFQLLPDETKMDFDDIRDLITTEVVDIDTASGLWDAAKKMNPEDVALGTLERRLLARTGAGWMTQQSQVDNGLKVHSFWLLPGTYRKNKFLADGVMLRWAQDEELEFSDSFPFNDGRMPFAFFQHIPSNATIWPDSIMTHIRDPNLEMDKTMSQLIENKDYITYPQWRIATQHQIVGEFKSRPGGILRYVHAPNVPPPEPIPGIPMPAQVENIVVGLRDQILDISGQGETSRGRVPSGVRSGVAVAYLQEEDETRLGPTAENWEDATAMMGSLTLSRVAQFYTTERTARVNQGKYWDVIRFKGADVKGTTDVIAVTHSALPKSKAARQQNILDMVQMGIETDRKRIREVLELGEAEPDEIDLAIAQAQRENQQMLLGTVMTAKPAGIQPTVVGAGEEVPAPVPPVEGQLPGMENVQQEQSPMAIPVKSWHNHEVHLKEHYGMMMSEEFDEMAKENPEVVRLFDEHTHMHETVLAQQRQQQMQMMLAARGGPNGGMGEVPNQPSESRPDAMQDEASTRQRSQR